MKGRKPLPTSHAVSRSEGSSLTVLPRCPAHLSDIARNEWRRLAKPLHDRGILLVSDRAALAAYCQSYARWVEAEQKLKETPLLLKTPSGYVQQSPWLSVANKQLELMGRYMAELGLTPSARSRIGLADALEAEQVNKVQWVVTWRDGKGNRVERPVEQAERDDVDAGKDVSEQ